MPGERKFIPSLSIKSFWELLKLSPKLRAICSACTAAPDAGSGDVITPSPPWGKQIWFPSTAASVNCSTGLWVGKKGLSLASAASCQLLSLDIGDDTRQGDALHSELSCMEHFFRRFIPSKAACGEASGGNLISFQKPFKFPLHNMFAWSAGEPAAL